MIDNNQFFKLNNLIFRDALDKYSQKEHGIKCIELYMNIALSSSHISNKFKGFCISWALNTLSMSKNSGNVKRIQNRLMILQKNGLIKFDINMENIGRNDYFDIDIVAEENYSFIKMYSYDYEVMELLETSEMVVYYYIRNYYNEKWDKAWFTIDKISLDLGMSKSTIKKVLDKLEEIRLIEIDNIDTYLSDGAGGVKKSNNTYKILEVPQDLKERIKKCGEAEFITIVNTEEHAPAKDEKLSLYQVFDWELTDDFNKQYKLVEELFGETFVYTEGEYQSFEEELTSSEESHYYYNQKTR